MGAGAPDEERQGIEQLIDWFMRAYPTPGARLAHVRQSYLSATALAPYPFR